MTKLDRTELQKIADEIAAINTILTHIERRVGLLERDALNTAGHVKALNATVQELQAQPSLPLR